MNSAEKSSRTTNIFAFGDHEIVRDAMARLSKVERVVVTLRFWENYTLDEIAEALGVTWKEVETFLAKALATLKELCLATSEFTRSDSGKGGQWKNQRPAPLRQAA